MTTGKTIALSRRNFVGKVMSLLLNMLPRLVITFLPRSKRLLPRFLKKVQGGRCMGWGSPAPKHDAAGAPLPLLSQDSLELAQEVGVLGSRSGFCLATASLGVGHGHAEG